MPKLRITVVTECNVELEHFPGAKTLAEAAKMQKAWVDDGTCDIFDLLMSPNALTVTIEAVEEEKADGNPPPSENS